VSGTGEGRGPEPLLWHFHDAQSGTFTHLVACPFTRRAALINPVLGFNPCTGRTSTHAAERIAALLRGERLFLDWVLETHVHADHLSAAQFFRELSCARVGIGARVRGVQRLYAHVFGPAANQASTWNFDGLWEEGQRIPIGRLEVEVMATPGHTLDGVTYRVGRHAFVGDTVFRANFGTARADLIGGDAATLFHSLTRLYALPPDTLLHFCHDYPARGDEPCEQMPLERMRIENIHMSPETSEAAFVARRRARDATLPTPDLLIPAVQVNLAAGRLPAVEANGISYLKVPINGFAR
jgi:glyoxylase-like metal-dependent hydrolase (beta-lactamase superfamily II)